MNTKFSLRGNKELEAKLQKMPFGYKRIALEAFADYTLGDESHGLKWYPPPMGQKYVRTEYLRNAWTIHDTQGGYRPVITNAMDYAEYVPNVWGAGGYINYGWRQWADVIRSNFAGAIRHAQAAVNAWLRAGAK